MKACDHLRLLSYLKRKVVAEADKKCWQVLLKVDAPQPKVLGFMLWSTANPQFEWGHLEIVKESEVAES